MSTLTRETQAGDRRQVRRERPGHRQHPGPGRAAHRSGSTISPSTCASTRRTTTRAAGCSCSSAAPPPPELPAASNDLEGYRALIRSSACASSRGHHRAGHARSRSSSLQREDGSDFTQRRPRGPTTVPGLLPVRLQPGLHRPAPGLRGGRCAELASAGATIYGVSTDATPVADGVPREARRLDRAALRLRAQGRDRPRASAPTSSPAA